jgi:hypothetical protein
MYSKIKIKHRYLTALLVTFNLANSYCKYCCTFLNKKTVSPFYVMAT